MDFVLMLIGVLLALLLLVYVSQIAAASKAQLKETKAQNELLQKLVWQGQKAHAREERKIEREFEEG